jgi:hypothetical protein
LSFRENEEKINQLINFNIDCTQLVFLQARGPTLQDNVNKNSDFMSKEK